MSRNFLAILVFFSFPAAAWDVEGDTRANIESNRAHQASASLRWGFDITPVWTAEIGSRVAAAWIDVDSLHYKLGTTYAPLPFLFFDFGLFHVQRFRGTNATSHLWGQARLEGGLFDSVRGFFALGWYERFTRLDKTWVVPTFRGDVREHDFTVAFGLQAALTREWELRASLATFDTLEIYNLNHPYVELRSIHQFLGPATVEAYGRYQVLLGFGRWDNLTFGVAFRVAIPEAPEEDT